MMKSGREGKIQFYAIISMCWNWILSIGGGGFSVGCGEILINELQ